MIGCEENKVELPCNCLAASPSEPRPVALPWMYGIFKPNDPITVEDNTSTSENNLPILQANGFGAVQVNTFVPFGRYVNAPTITINPPIASDTAVLATATVILNSARQISGIIITNAGVGYTPYAYYGYTISAEPPASTLNMYTDLNTTGTYFNKTFIPINFINANTPPLGWSPATVTTLTCVFKVSGAFKRDTIGTVNFRFKINGAVIGAALKIEQTLEDTLTNFTHISKEVTCNLNDIINYEITTTDEAHITYVGPIVGLFIPKF